MDSLIVFTAQYVAYLIVVAAFLIWLLLPRPNKVALVVQGAVTLVVVLVLIVVAGHLHTDPRPFVTNPSVHPLFAHAADNGFPSDHTALATAVGLLIALYRRVAGAVLFLCGIGVGAARVAAHVHHTQDIVAGAVIGIIGVLIAVAVWRAIAPAVTGWPPLARWAGTGVARGSADR